MSEFLSDSTDLEQMRYIKQDGVKRLVDAVNAIPDTEEKSPVVVFGTGGTIACVPSDAGKVPELGFDEVLQLASPQLAANFVPKGLQAYNLDSSQVSLDHVRDLAIAILFVMKHTAKKLRGVLILHGTDTMAEDSSRMAMMLGQGLNFPIVYTGAQQSIQRPINDAAENVRNALYTVEGMYRQGVGEVVITMGDAVLQATGARKMSDSSKNAFDTPMHELLVDLSRLPNPIELASWSRKPTPGQKMNPRLFGGYTGVLDIISKMSINPKQAAGWVDEYTKAVLLTTYGAGTSGLEVAESVAEVAHERGVPLFMASPVNSDPSLGGYAPGQRLMEIGFQPLVMTPEVARAKLDLALRRNPEADLVTEFMTAPLIGEVPTSVTTRRSPLLRV